MSWIVIGLAIAAYLLVVWWLYRQVEQEHHPDG